MSYESWRISYQSSEAAARAAYATTEKLHAELTALREQMAAIGAGGVEPLRKPATAPKTVQAADAQDAARWREAIKHVGAEGRFSATRYVIQRLEAPRNVMRGSVAGHFTKSIDAALAAQAKQEVLP